MANLDKFHENPRGQLFEELDGVKCVMLGSPKAGAHMQPMSPQIDKDHGTIYFYSDNQSDLGQDVLAMPGTVQMCHIGKDYQTCVRGKLSPHMDKVTIDKFWNPVVAAWYPNGKDDAKLMMLKFEPEHASIWASDTGTVGFLFEIAKANIKNEQADMGEHREIDL